MAELTSDGRAYKGQKVKEDDQEWFGIHAFIGNNNDENKVYGKLQRAAVGDTITAPLEMISTVREYVGKMKPKKGFSLDNDGTRAVIVRKW